MKILREIYYSGTEPTVCRKAGSEAKAERQVLVHRIISSKRVLRDSVNRCAYEDENSKYT